MQLSRRLVENHAIYICCVFSLLNSFSTHTTAEPLETGKGSFRFKTQGKKTIRVWYYKPDSPADTVPIVFVMHGVKRNGEDYRDTWIRHAKQGCFLLLVPEFSKKDYPGSAGYNLGNMFSPSGKKNKEKEWSYTVIEHLFDHVKKISGSTVSAYSMYGHSAGAQFVQRFVMFKPKARIQTAIAANAGWYTMPMNNIKFPYGLKGSGKQLKDMSASFDKNLIILLGDKDIDENHKHLRKTAKAMKQGRHRFARGRSFYRIAKKAAQTLGAPFHWTLKIVPGVGHSNSAMSAHAAKLLCPTPK